MSRPSIRIHSSGAPDIVRFRIYFKRHPPFSYQDPFFLVPSGTDAPPFESEVNLPDGTPDGLYCLSVVEEDSMGKLSDFSPEIEVVWSTPTCD